MGLRFKWGMTVNQLAWSYYASALYYGTSLSWLEEFTRLNRTIPGHPAPSRLRHVSAQKRLSLPPAYAC
jgi:hypothetical protein